MNDTQETVLAALRELDAVKARLARLEGARSCSDESHKSSAGTTNTPAAVASSVSSSGSPSASPTSGGSTAKPAWLAPLLPLPEGTERVRRLTRLGRSEYAAFPGGEVWLIPADHPGHWTDPGWAANEYTSMWESAEVYHVLLEHQAPSPAKIEHQTPSSPDIEQERGEVFKVLPPLEIADHAEALGWTEGSEVYDCGCKSYRVYPSGMSLIDGKVRPTNSNAEKCEKLGHRPLPNRRVPVEGEKPATAWEEWLGLAENIPISNHQREHFNRFVADRERRAVDGVCKHPVLVYQLPENKNRCAKCGMLCDVLVPLAAPSPRPAKSAGEVAEECIRVIEDRVSEHMSSWTIGTIKRTITAAIERERERKA